MKRNSIEIRVWLHRNRLKQADILRDLGFKDGKTVWATVEGRENNRKVLGWLVDKGCPTRHLALPANMKSSA